MTANPEISVKIAADGSQATLVAPPGLDASLLTQETLLFQVKAAGVLIVQEVERSVSAFAAAYGSGAAARSDIVARWDPPVAGEDGRVEWHKGFDPRPEHATPSEVRTDHYQGQHYVRVKTGDVVGIAHRPTGGTDGRDVRGGVITARAGKPVAIKCRPMLTIDSGGRIITQADGVLVLSGNELSVTQSLDVPGHVDFSTGNIDFPGSVAIAGGVGSGFKVTAGGDIHIGGLIEVAEIRCGGDLIARGGMAGNGRGTINVVRNVQIVYLEKVAGALSGDLIVEREIADCKLIVGRDLKCPNGTILGGEITVTGSLVVKAIGSESYTPTAITLGDVPLLQSARGKVAKMVEQINATLVQFAEQARLIKLNPRPSAPDKEKLTEISFEASQQNQELAKWAAKLSEIETAVTIQRKLDVHVSKTIHPGVTFHIGAFAVEFKDAAKGPIWICWDEQRQLMYRTGSDAARPLADIAKIKRVAQAAPAPARLSHGNGGLRKAS